MCTMSKMYEINFVTVRPLTCLSLAGLDIHHSSVVLLGEVLE